MLHLLIEQHADLHADWSVLFCNTGKEDDRTLDFVHEIETRWNVPVVWLEYCRVPASQVDPLIYPHPKSQQTIRDQQERGDTSHWFRVVNFETAHRNDPMRTDSPFDELLSWASVLPNVRGRSCTAEMKIRTMQRYLYATGITSWLDYIGIRSDEADRAIQIRAAATKDIMPAFPLIDAGITVRDVDEFWTASPFDLQLEQWMGNCDGCFLKSTAKRKRLARQFPERFAWWERQEEAFSHKGDGGLFRRDQPYETIRKRATVPALFDIDDEVPCGCADGGFKVEHEDT
jgi:hypothetical protein